MIKQIAAQTSCAEYLMPNMPEKGSWGHVHVNSRCLCIQHKCEHEQARAFLCLTLQCWHVPGRHSNL